MWPGQRGPLPDGSWPSDLSRPRARRRIRKVVTKAIAKAVATAEPVRQLAMDLATATGPDLDELAEMVGIERGRAGAPERPELLDASLAGRASAIRYPLGDEPPAGYDDAERAAWTVSRLRHLARRFGHKRPQLAELAGYSNRGARRRSPH